MPMADGPQPRRHGCLWAILAAFTAVLVAAIVLAVNISTDHDHDPNAMPLGDATVTSCGPTGTQGRIYAKGTVRNSSPESTNLLVVADAISSSGKFLGNGWGEARDLAPGKVAKWEGLMAVSPDQWDSGVTCKVASVTKNFP